MCPPYCCVSAFWCLGMVVLRGDKLVHENGRLVLNLADEHHSTYYIRPWALLVYQRKGGLKAVGNASGTFGLEGYRQPLTSVSRGEG